MAAAAALNQAQGLQGVAELDDVVVEARVSVQASAGVQVSSLPVVLPVNVSFQKLLKNSRGDVCTYNGLDVDSHYVFVLSHVSIPPLSFRIHWLRPPWRMRCLTKNMLIWKWWYVSFRFSL